MGTAGIPYQSAYLRTIAKGAGVDPSTVRETNVGFNLVPAMLTHKVDATLGAFWNYEGVQLQRAGKHPHIIRVDAAGVPTYSELVLAARGAALHEGGARIRRFLLALAEAHQLLRRDPAAGRRPAREGQPRPGPRAPARVGPRDAAGLLPRRPHPPVGLDGLRGLGDLRALDAGPGAASSGRRRPPGR